MDKIVNYIDKIAKLPLKENYTHEEILTSDFLIARDGNMEIFYCTHNEYMNPSAKIFIVGITPGFQQMSKSIATARQCLDENRKVEEIPYICKREGRFYGMIRKNIINMLDELELNKPLGLDSCGDLFDESDYLLHTTSLIPFAVLINRKNYTGYSPKILKNSLLQIFLSDYFEPQAAAIQDALIIPLGKGVEEVLKEFRTKGVIKKENILSGFPHPSGANGHRLRQFEENKEKMKAIINNFFPSKNQ